MALSQNHSTYNDVLNRKILYREPIVIVPLTLSDVSKVGSGTTQASFYSQFINEVKRRVEFSYKLYDSYNNNATLILRSIFKNKGINDAELHKLGVNAQDVILLF